MDVTEAHRVPADAHRSSSATSCRRGTFEDGARLQWRFSEITDTTFTWTGYTSYDEGTSWRLEQEMSATRDGRAAQAR
jgi:hypothetical protein